MYRIGAVPEATIELSVSDLQQAGPPPLDPGLLRLAERTISMSDADLIVLPRSEDDNTTN